MDSIEEKTNLRLLLNGWLDGSIRSYGYIAGSDSLKNFLKGAAQVMVAHLQEAADQQGVPFAPGREPEGCIRMVAQLENALGIFPPDQVSVEPDGDFITLHLTGCPYAQVCSGILNDLIENSMGQAALPCFRTEAYLAPVNMDTSHKTRYVLKQFAPGVRCTSVVEVVG